MRRSVRWFSAVATASMLLASGGCVSTGAPRAAGTSAGTDSTATSASAQPAAVFEGVYALDTTEADGLTVQANIPPENWGHWVFVFGRGRFAYTQNNERQSCTWGYGTYAVTGATVQWLYTDGGGKAPRDSANDPGEQFTFGWTLYRDTLTLTAVPGAVSPAVLTVKPWHRLSGTPSSSFLNHSCLPPPAALTW